MYSVHDHWHVLSPRAPMGKSALVSCDAHTQETPIQLVNHGVQHSPHKVIIHSPQYTTTQAFLE